MGKNLGNFQPLKNIRFLAGSKDLPILASSVWFVDLLYRCGLLFPPPP
jgi:hypothetical protein